MRLRRRHGWLACALGLACSWTLSPTQAVLAAPAPQSEDGPAESSGPATEAPSPTDGDSPPTAASVPEILGDEPADPNDEAFTRAPNGQLQQWSRGAPHGRSQSFRAQRRIALTVAPVYAAFRWPFVGRGTARIRGGGALLEVDARILRFLWARLQASHTMHPVEDLGQVEDDDSLTPVARAGLMNATHAGAGLAYALDLGRVLPLIDAGAGLMWISSPEAVQAGQNGGECLEGNVCETGLRCGSLGLCEPAATPVVNAGIGVDFLLGRYWHVGIHVRYFALLSNPSDFPVYYTGALRLGARF